MSEATPPRSSPPCDVIVVSYNQRERLLACLASVRGAAPAARLIVVDNASADASARAAQHAFPDADVVPLDTNVGFAAAVNRGAARGSAPFVLLLNNDARLTGRALDEMLLAMEAEDVGAAGPRLSGPDGEIELSVNRRLSPLNEAYFKVLQALYGRGTGLLAGFVRRLYGRSRLVRSLSGACILLRRAAFDDVGGFDERFFLYAEDVDLCARLTSAGWKLAYVAAAVVEHDRGASVATAPRATALHYRRSQMAFYRKHHGALAVQGLRLYLAFRFAIERFVGRGEQRELAAELLRWTLRESGR